MRGKVGLVIGLGIGYVLGTRAGRERYEQIKEQALKVWNLDPVQKQVENVKDVAKTTASALPAKLVEGVTKAVKAATDSGGSNSSGSKSSGSKSSGGAKSSGSSSSTSSGSKSSSTKASADKQG